MVYSILYSQLYYVVLFHLTFKFSNINYEHKTNLENLKYVLYLFHVIFWSTTLNFENMAESCEVEKRCYAYSSG